MDRLPCACGENLYKVRLLDLVVEDRKDSTKALRPSSNLMTKRIMRLRNKALSDLMHPFIVLEPAGRFCVYCS